MVENHDGKPALKQLIDAYNQVQASIVGVQTVPEEDVSKYGIVEHARGEDIENKRVKLRSMVEKPKMQDAPSRMAVLGRYVLTPEIFDYLETQTPGAGGEIQLTDAIKNLMISQSVYAYDFEGIRYDVGDKFGFIKATIEYALEREELRDKLQGYLKELAATF